MTTVKQEGTKKVLLATYAIIGLLVFSAAQTAIVGYLNDKHFGAIDLAWSDLSSRHQTKLRLISDIRADIGYGGIIHDFKNLVIRGDRELYDNLIDNFKQIKANVHSYREFVDTQSESEALDDLARILERYEQLTTTVLDYKSEGMSVENVDNLVKVNDRPALIALNALEEAVTDGFDGALDRVQDEVSSGQTTAAFGFVL